MSRQTIKQRLAALKAQDVGRNKSSQFRHFYRWKPAAL